MDKNCQALLAYLRDIGSNPSKSSLDLDKLDGAFADLGKGLMDLAQSLSQERALNRKKTAALEQIKRLLTNITQHIPQQIIVVDRQTRELLFMSLSARHMAVMNMGYVETLMETIASQGHPGGWHDAELQYSEDGEIKYLSVTSYFIEWEESSAEAFVISDISTAKKQIQELETHAYRDAMTHLYNRFYGMLTLNQWLDEKRTFALIFADLDNLKFINDRFGHPEGDKYIANAAKHLRPFSPDAVVCRLGGDEFMLLAPGIGHDDALARMNEICRDLQNDPYLTGREYFYRVSFGIVAVGEANSLSASDILSLADEKMYEHKRMRKKHP